MKNVLFVCTGNSCRSVMAEGLFKKAVQGREHEFVVGSAGIAAADGFPSTPETIRAMKEEGVDVASHKARRLTRTIAEKADEIFVMEKMHQDMIVDVWPDLAPKVHLLTEYSPQDKGKEVLIDVPDPIRMSDQFYRNVRKMIEDCIANIAKSV